ncbi:hypothetical protein C8F04DRAFT_1229604 [Mycena alexandri]|uniref:Uncharacterized protein n=1 Tax=Mycena alexandri TaxID=1745969 RepID=A0AAD6TEK9_9AGAR|nr:hypothetical protein C8F04DRAFT_1229604 [Mycena alexandri]
MEMDDMWIPFIALLPLKRFYGPSWSLLSMLPSNIMFSHLTHLELHDSIDSEDTNALIAFLASLPALTHLAFDDLNASSLCSSLLNTCKSLCVLVILLSVVIQRFYGDHTQDAVLVQDSRFVCIRCDNYLHDWLMGARWGLDYWHRAELVIAKRRAREIDPLQIDLLEDQSLDIVLA